MLNPLISSYLFLIASVSVFIAALFNLSKESSLDNLYLLSSLSLGLMSIAMFRKYKREKRFSGKQQIWQSASNVQDGLQSGS